MDNIISRKCGGNRAVSSAPHLATFIPRHCGGGNRAFSVAGAGPSSPEGRRPVSARSRSKRSFSRKNRRK
ncbi:hypothetical protein NPIL_417971, partial [Nephila pilipes]